MRENRKSAGEEPLERTQWTRSEPRLDSYAPSRPVEMTRAFITQVAAIGRGAAEFRNFEKF